MKTSLTALALALVTTLAPLAAQVGDVAVYGDRIHTMVDGQVIEDGVVVVRDGVIVALGPARAITLPDGIPTRRAAVVVPGLIDAHTTLGLSGLMNQPQDQDHLDPGGAIQPELRAVDAYNARDPLIEWVRGYGVTTVHTGHSPGALVSGQTMVVKLKGTSVEDGLVVSPAMIAASLADSGRSGDGSPGTRAKSVAMLRAKLLAGKQRAEAIAAAAADEEKDAPDADLHLDALADLATGRVPLLVTAHAQQDIASALRLAAEFPDLRLVLDGGAEAHLMLDEIVAAGVSLIAHPPMMRPGSVTSDRAAATFELPRLLDEAGVPFALQTGYEAYVPKIRVLPFEAAIAARYGLPAEEALAAVTIDAARLLGLEDRIGSLASGKAGDLALYDGDPFEYTTHCVGVVIDGVIMSDETR